MGTCRVCGGSDLLISDAVGVCVDCLRWRPRKALEVAARAHRISRTRFKRPAEMLT